MTDRRRHWRAKEPFFNFRASHCVEIILTVMLVLVGYLQYVVYRRQARIMETDERAWMKVVEVKPEVAESPQYFPDGLVFADGSSVASLRIVIVAKNVGHSPAFDVRAGAWPLYGYADDHGNLTAWESQRCSSLVTPLTPRIIDNTASSQVMFPDDEFTFNEGGLGMMNADIPVQKAAISKRFQLWFYGCIRYITADGSEHHTNFAYRVVYIEPNKSAIGGLVMVPDFEFGVSIPAAQLRFLPRPMTALQTN